MGRGVDIRSLQEAKRTNELLEQQNSLLVCLLEELRKLNVEQKAS